MRSTLVVILSALSMCLHAQVQPTVKYDSLAGNYQIQFQGSSGIVNSIFEPATKVVPHVNARVTKGDNQGEFVYSYELANGRESRQRLIEIAIDIKSDIHTIVRPNGEWSAMMYDKVRRLSWAHTMAGPAGLRNRYTGVPADSSCAGFSFRSLGLPGISNCYFLGVAKTIQFDEEPPPEVERILDSLTLFPRNNVIGHTLAPFDPAGILGASPFLDTLAIYISQARSLEWIRDNTTSSKYLGNFALAKTQLQTNNTAGTRTTLQMVLQDVKADSTSDLSSEAYAIIRYNTEYLLGQLPTAPPPSGLGVKLVSSTGTNLTGGSLQYYDGSWKDAVNNNDGTFNVNTTSATVSLRMTYEGGSQTKSNVAVGPNVVVFQTVNTQVRLQNSQGALIDTGTVQYYYSSWRTLGQTMNGVASKELLPANYTFRMTYANASNDKQQNTSSNPIVVFSTVNAQVQLKNSQGTPIDTGTVQYYFSSWQTLGQTLNGVANKELLPATYTFRMGYASAVKDKQQNIATSPTVVFSTVNAQVQLKNSQGALINQGSAQYYFSSWKPFSQTLNGVANKELLPVSYTFRMTHQTVTNDKVQDISTNSTVNFSTVLCTVTVKNGQGQLIDGAQVSYYFSSWVPIGPTVGGQVTKELLPANLTFRETIGSTTQNKQQNIGTNALVEFVVQ